MKYFLAVDIGTTSCKTVGFSTNGEILASVSNGYAMHHPEPDRSEQDPEEIFNAVLNGVNEVIAALMPALPAFISFSAAMHSLIAVDHNGNLLTQCIIWADNRADEVAASLRMTLQGRDIYQTTGVPIHAMTPLCKLLWFRQNQPEIFDSVHKFIGIKEYVFYRLTSRYIVDTSIASATGLLNIRSLQWDEAVLRYAGISTALLSQVVSSKYVIDYSGSHPHLTLPAGTKMVIGASDGALSNLGTGAVGDDRLAVTIGTSGAVRLLINRCQTDPAMRTFCYHLKDDFYIIGGANNNGAVILQWLRETLLNTTEDYDRLFELAAAIQPGADGLLLLPYLLGERAPHWNSNAKGVFFGISIQHTRSHFIRAVLEAVIYAIYSIGTIIMEKQPVKEIHASGGFARNELWLQILSDVFNCKVIVSGSVESSALGAVMLGAEALGLPASFHHKVISTFTPNLQAHKVYAECFKKFERLYPLLKNEMK